MFLLHFHLNPFLKETASNLVLQKKTYGFTVANGKQYTISAQGVIDFIDGIRGEYSDLALIGADLGGKIKQKKYFDL